MTCIVGVVAPDGVWMGGDSAAISGWDLTRAADPKVFTNGDYLIGYTTSFRMGQLLRFADLPKPLDRAGDELLGFLVTEFVNAVRTVLKDGGFAKKDSEVESGGTFLVAVNGRLFEVYSDYQVHESRDDYAAVGSGAQVASGSLHATPRLGPRKRIERALTAAAHHSAGVHGPFTIVRSG